MILSLSVKTRHGRSGDRLELDGWTPDQSGPVTEPASIGLYHSGEHSQALVRLNIDPAVASLRANAAGGSLHYFRLADATLRPLPAEAAMSLERGDTYIALSPGAARVAGSPAIARFLHLRDYFNAERLAEGVLDFLAEERGQAEFPEDVTVLVVEAR